MSDKVKLEELVEGLELEADVFDPSTGFLLLRADTVIQAHHLDRMKQAKVESVRIKDVFSIGEEIEEEEGETELEMLTEEAEAIWEIKRISSPINPGTESSVSELLNAIWSEGRLSSRISSKLVDGIKNAVSSIISETRLRKGSLPILAHPKNNMTGQTNHLLNCAIVGARLMETMEKHPMYAAEFVSGLLLADIGKSRLPVKILEKPEELDEKQWETIKRHPALSLETVQQMNILPEEIETAIHFHHEDMGGSGYPKGLNSFEIPEAARLYRIVDCYSALCEDRTYRPRFTYADAMKELVSGHGSRFEPDGIKLMIETFGFYPPGAIVRLSDNRLAVVVGVAPRQEPLLPRVKIIAVAPGEEAPLIELSDRAENPHGLSVSEELL